MDDTPLGQRPEVMFPDKDEDLPPHLLTYANHGHMVRPILRKHLGISQVRPYTQTIRSYLTRFLQTR